MFPNNYSNITAVEGELKELCSQEVEQTLDSQEQKKLKESIIDFLYRLKDKHPSSTSLSFIASLFANSNTFDVAHRVMDFMRDNNLKPSKALIEEYRLSKTTKTLNRFPSYEELKEKLKMEEWSYDMLKKAYRNKIIKINNK